MEKKFTGFLASIGGSTNIDQFFDDTSILGSAWGHISVRVSTMTVAAFGCARQVNRFQLGAI